MTSCQLCLVHTVKKSRRLTKRQETLTLFSWREDDVAAVTTPEQFKALGHPMRHRLLFALGQGEATISQLAAALGSNKGNIAHHLKVLADAGLVRPAGTRQVRGGTEQYYQRASRGLTYDDAANYRDGVPRARRGDRRRRARPVPDAAHAQADCPSTPGSSPLLSAISPTSPRTPATSPATACCSASTGQHRHPRPGNNETASPAGSGPQRTGLVRISEE